MLLISDQITDVNREQTQTELSNSQVERKGSLKEELYYVGIKWYRRQISPKVRFDDGLTTRVGCLEVKKQKMISHPCYQKGHISPQCPFKLYQLNQVVAQ